MQSESSSAWLTAHLLSTNLIVTSTFIAAAAQACSRDADVVANVAEHVALAERAAEHGARLVIFPELSLTGYLPPQAHRLALRGGEPALAPLADTARRLDLVLVAGCPIPSDGEHPYIGALIFAPDGSMSIYRKRFLDPTEEPYFVASRDTRVLDVAGERVGVAICADVEHPAHPAAAHAAGATVYAAGVLMTPKGILVADARMAEYAARHGMLALMANHATDTGAWTTAGRSAAWTPDGALLARAEGNARCLVLAASTADGWRGEVVAA